VAVDAAAHHVAFKGRREDDRLLKGEGRYTADVNLPGQLYGCFVRSDRAHAEIVKIDLRGANGFTGEDMKSLKTPPSPIKTPGRGGVAIRTPHRPTLALHKVRFVGDPVALVVADSPQAAQDAAEAVEVEYRELPAVVLGSEALKSGAPQLHDDLPGNLSFDFEYGDEKAAAEAFARAAHITRIALESTRLSGNPMEPKACVAAYDAASGVFDLYAPSQGIPLMMPGLTGAFGLPAEKFRIHARDVGGGFGIRSQAYPEYCALLFAARALGRPVKWVGSRFETIVGDHHGRAVELAGELALDRDGRFIGMRFDWICDLGAYASSAGPLINTINPSLHAINAYDIRAMYGRHRLAMTNTTPITAYRGAGRPNVTYLVERLVEEAARETGVDRVELRRRNLIQPDAYPYKTPTGNTYDSGDLPGLLDRAVRFSNWSSFEIRRKESLGRKKLRGIGLAMFVEPSGQAPIPKEEAMIKFGDSGNAELYVMSGSSGQGHETVYPDIVAAVLGMDAERIVLRESDPMGPVLAGGATVGSRSTMTHASALSVTAHEVVKKGLELAAKDLEVSSIDLEFKNGRYHVKGTDISLGFLDVAKKHGSALDSSGSMKPQGAYPGGAHVAEVEIDPETGVVEVLNYVGVDDCGRVINHTLLEGQLHGGVAQGIGQALGEHVIYDESGQILTGSFMDYPMPRASDQPRTVAFYDHSVPSPTNPLGVKGVGEAGTVGAVPTLANAVIDALRARGIHHLEFPYSPSRIWSALNRTAPSKE